MSFLIGLAGVRTMLESCGPSVSILRAAPTATSVPRLPNLVARREERVGNAGGGVGVDQEVAAVGGVAGLDEFDRMGRPPCGTIDR